MHARAGFRDRRLPLTGLIFVTVLWLSPTVSWSSAQVPPPQQAPAQPEDAVQDEAVPEEAVPGEAAQEEGAPPTAEVDGERAVADVDVRLDGNVLSARRGLEQVWTRILDPTHGEPLPPVTVEDQVAFAQGPYLLFLDAASGEPLARTGLPGLPQELRPEGLGVVVTVAGRTGVRHEVEIRPGDEAVGPFDLPFQALVALRTAADALAPRTAQGAAERDPTDPWPALRAASEARTDATRERWRDEAVARAAALPWWERAALGSRLLAAGDETRGGPTLEGALRDMHRAGVDPRTLIDPQARSAYGLPHEPFVAALDRGDLPAARPLAPFAWRTATEAAPDTVTALERYAGALQAAGDRAEAQSYRERARAAQHAGLASWIDDAAAALARLGYAGVAGLAAVLALTWLTLLAKVWHGQSLLRKQARERGRPIPGIARVWVPRTASTSEKLVLLALLVSLPAMAVLASWGQRAAELPPLLLDGSWSDASTIATLERLPGGPHAEALRGLAAAIAGDRDEALRRFEAAPDVAWATTNRAVLRGLSGTELRNAANEALRTDPREPVARWLAGREVHPSPFHQAYGGDDPVLAVPTVASLRSAVAGDWRAALGRMLRDPFGAAAETRPSGWPAFVWWPLVVAFLLLVLAVALATLLRRPRVVRDAPRSAAYQALALAVPGSGHADEGWGLLLLVPSGLLAADIVTTAATGAPPLGLSTLTTGILVGVVYLANTVGWTVELQSYRRRMRDLRRERPELARAFGLPPAKPGEGTAGND